MEGDNFTWTSDLNVTELYDLYQTMMEANVTEFTKKTNLPLWYETGRVQIPLYAIIFLLAVIGNTLVIVTLVQNQRMRTITNLFLLNLAVSDLLLGVLCMPFTLIGAPLLREDFVPRCSYANSAF
ncbi:cholecystokinin receptor type A-like [Atheta coriaria]|uniref:cholecystokinin receptor type A-like n=1 Tax=Dalotia coriaria TaxID=877792 RepID=UPI0031F3D0EC